jgi:hypothetical protein
MLACLPPYLSSDSRLAVLLLVASRQQLESPGSLLCDVAGCITSVGLRASPGQDVGEMETEPLEPALPTGGKFCKNKFTLEFLGVWAITLDNTKFQLY